MKKEYDSSMTIDEVVARLRENTVPSRGSLFKDWYSWVRWENFDGTYTIARNNHARGNVHATLKIQSTSQGTHTVLKTDSWWKFLCLCCFILLDVSSILVYRGYAISSIILALCLLAFWILIDWSRERSLIDFFETDILGIK